VQFKKYSSIYNKINSIKNYFNEVEYILKKYDNKEISKKLKILELGSGTGNHAEEFIKRGYSVDGIEKSTEMIKHGFKSSQYNVINEDILKHNNVMKYDLVISLFHVISYINDDDDINILFKKTRNNLKNGGKFMFDTWFTPAVYSIKPTSRVVKFSNNDEVIIRISNSELYLSSNTVNVNFEFKVFDLKRKLYTEFNETHIMRHFSINEIKTVAEKTNFKLIEAEEYLTGNELSTETWGSFFILEAI
jgi:SAM-dependent methyltransferase